MQHKIGESENNNNTDNNDNNNNGNNDFNNNEKMIQPKRGDIVSFSYDNFSQRSLPVNPKILRIRTDVTWENVVQDFLIHEKASSDSSLFLNGK